MGRSFEEEIIRKVILDERGSRAGWASSWSARATVETIEIESNETNCSTSELFATEGASCRWTFFEDVIAAIQAQYMSWEGRGGEKPVRENFPRQNKGKTDRMGYNGVNYGDQTRPRRRRTESQARE